VSDNNNAAFAAVHCNETETVCSGGEGRTIQEEDDGPVIGGGTGFHETQTTDSSTFEATFSGGGGSGIVGPAEEPDAGGDGGSLTCTMDLTTGEYENVCSQVGSGGL